MKAPLTRSALASLCLFSFTKLFAFNPSGGLSFAQGSRGLLVSGLFSAYNNPAHALDEKYPGIAYSVSNFYALRAVHAMHLTSVKPFRNTLIGASVFNWGNGVYNASEYSLSLGQALNNDIQMGLRCDYRSRSIPFYGQKGYFNIDVFMCYTVQKKLKTALSIAGILQHGELNKTEQYTSKAFEWAMVYPLDKKADFYLSIEKPFYFKTQISPSLLYKIDSSFAVNLGFSNAFKEIGLGMRLIKKRFQYAWACRLHLQLGISSNISISYAFKK